MEEIDLCWRSHKLGYKVVYQPKSVVYHLGGGSLPIGNPRKVFYNYRNNLIMMTKNLDKNPVFRIFGRLCLDGVAGMKALFSGRPKDTWAIIRAHFAFYGRLTDTLKNRRELRDKQTVSTPTHLVYQKSVIVDYFLRGKKRFSDLKFQ